MTQRHCELAILGGAKVRTTPFPAHVTVGEEEKRAVIEVMDGGILSNYLGSWHENFMGGKTVRACEAAWARHFGAEHALAVNSNTSGLIAALGAIGVGAGDEVIVTPYSMSASAIAPIFWGATPIFADVESDMFCMDTASVEAAIGPNTRAIVVTDLFGQPFDPAMRELARKHGIKIVEDCAQAPGAMLNGKNAGLLGDVGVFSLNYHKHIHSGEGGIIVTDDAELAERIALIRNHAESVVGGKGVTDLTNMIGFNFRMTEIEAAIAMCQLAKLDGLLEERWERVAYFESRMSGFEALTMPKVREGAKHAFYVHACRWNRTATNVPRDVFVNAVKAELPHFDLREKEGVKLGAGYVRPLYMLPAFAQRQALGRNGFPLAGSRQDYAPGLCPVVEDLHFNTLVTHEFIVPSMSRADIDDVVRAFEKVWDQREKLL